MPFTNILFPVDFSDRCRAMAPQVKSMCERFNASLTVLHLVEVPVQAFSSVEAPILFQFPMDQLKRKAEQQLEKFSAASFPGIAVTKVVDEGDTASCIAELARVWGIDLIMLPTRGQGRFRSALLGSVTAKILHDATCAVWTEAHCESARPARADWRSVICALETVPEGLRLIHFAAGLAAAPGVDVRLVHAVPRAEAGLEKYFDREFGAFLRDRANESIAGMQKEAGTAFEVCIGGGSIVDVVRQAAVSHKADLVLIGRGALPHFAGRLRSHAYAIIRDMPCPVISI